MQRTGNKRIWMRRAQGIIPVIAAALLAACAGERPATLGVKAGRLALCPASPNCVASQMSGEPHAIAPLSIKGDPDAGFARLAALLKGRADTEIIAATGDYLQVEFRTTFFVDDGEFVLDRAAHCIHLRSASRVGYSDLGKNRSRIEEIRRDFEKGSEQ